MRKIKFTPILALFLALFLIVPAGADVTGVPGLTWYTLDNGLEVFIYESHAVPLVPVEVVFRCGSVSQRPETAGLFHLYEHMLFKGNNVLRSDSDFQAAMKELGVTSWNGGTSNEFVNYYFTVPSDKVEKGIAFWSAAVRTPLFRESELATERDVVVNEIRGTHNTPKRIYDAALTYRLFYQYPWRKDTTGSENIIGNATVAQLREIQNTYYIPNNAAIIVAGDVNPGDIKRIINERLGDWLPGPASRPVNASPHPLLKADVYRVYADDSMHKEIALVDIRFRGPDVLDQTADTYAADLWLSLLEDPDGPFLNNIFKKVPGIYKKEATSASYYTQRDGGIVYFRTYLRMLPGQNLPKRVLEVKNVILEEMQLIASDPEYFSEEDFALIKTRFEDQMLLNRETSEQFTDSLSFFWSTASTAYYYGYLDNMKKVTRSAVASFVKEYVLSKKSVLGVMCNPAVWQAEKSNFKKARFSEITPQNAFWWQE